MHESNPIRVLIVDDHAVVRSGLACFLLAFEDLELVGEAANGQEALHLCGQIQPDVVLMDLVLPGMHGTATIGAIRQHHPQIRVIALTSFHEEGLIQAALHAGAVGYLLKNITASELAAAIRAAHAGRPTLAPEAAAALMQAATAPPVPGHDLTRREREVLALLIEGLNNSEIAQRLVVSRSTIKYHVSSILSKLGAASRTEAVALAISHHLARQRT